MRSLADFEFAPENILRDIASIMALYDTLNTPEWSAVWREALIRGYTSPQIVEAVGDILWHLQMGEWWRAQYPRLLAARPCE